MKHLFSLFIALVIMSSTVALAAEEEVEVEPEFTPEQIAQMQAWDDRVARAEDFRNRMLQTRQGIILFEEYATAMQQKLVSQRKNCRALRRKSNHATELNITQRCYRTLLLIQEDFVRKQRDVAASIPGIATANRIALLQALDELAEAIDALSFAIDNNVFLSIEELEASKKNLYEKYRQPVLLLSVIARAERNLTWTAHAMVRLLTVVENNPALSVEAFTAIDLSMQCFAQGETHLKSVLEQTTFAAASENLGLAQEHLKSCFELTRNAHKIYTESPSPPEPSAEE